MFATIVGGLVGLFTGISMLTISEIVMWIARDMMAIISSLVCGKKKKQSKVQAILPVK